MEVIFDLEDRVAGHVLGELFADRRVGRKDEQALGVLGQREFLRGAEHALGKLAAQLRFLDGEIAGQLRAGQRERDLVAVLVILRAANDLARAGAVVDLADAEPVGVRMLDGGKNLRDDDVRAVDAGGGDVLDLRAGEREPVEHLRHGHGEVDVVAEPAKREFHRTNRMASMRETFGGSGRLICAAARARELFLGVPLRDRVA